MTEVPKIVPSIVYDRLRAASSECTLPDRALPEQLGPEPAHLDADLLTAFAEQALSATERDGVLAHLALCGDCREVAALSLPAIDIDTALVAAGTEAARATPISTHTERNSPTWFNFAWAKFAWPSLRWAALTAGVAVVITVLAVHPGKRNEATLHSAKPPVATTTPRASGSEVASLSIESSPIASSPMAQSAGLAKANEARPKPEPQLSKKLKTEESVMPLQAETETLLADNRKDAAQADDLSAAPWAGTAAFDARTSRGSTETVEVSGAAADLVAVEPSAEARLMVRSETPAVEKAKAALQDSEEKERQKSEAAVTPAQASSQARIATYSARLASPASQPSANALARNVTWTIAAGVLQRSLDSGQSWQNAVRADRPLLCYASHEADVWTGGQAGTLFHSTNSGVTWTQVQPSVPGKTLSSDITQIEWRGDVRGAAEIVVSTSNHEIWSSADGGKTWEKTWEKK
jgi:hypothetical protein